MKMKNAFYLAASALVFFLLACGGDTETINETYHSTGYDTFPEGDFISDYDCDSSLTGKLLYSESFKTIYLCDGENWQVINGRAGKDGKNGENGHVGKAGKDGANGKNGSICAVSSTDERMTIVCDGDSSVFDFDWTVDMGCNIVSSTDTLITLQCDGDTVRIPSSLDGAHGADCYVEEVDSLTYRQVCGDSVFEFRKTIANGGADSPFTMCGEHSYDAKQDTCIGEIVFARCGDELFEKSQGFCMNDSLYMVCGKNIGYYKTLAQECREGIVYSKCGEAYYDSNQAFCRDGVVVGLLNE